MSVLGPVRAKATCLPAAALAPRRVVPPPPAVGVWNAEAGTCRASSSQRLIQQQPQQRPAGHRSSPDGRLVSANRRASPGRAVLPAVPSGEGNKRYSSDTWSEEAEWA